MEYELSTIGPLLEVLRSLDEERVTQHLREINERLAQQLYDPISDNIQVVSVMYEVVYYFFPHLYLICCTAHFLLVTNTLYYLTIADN